MVRVSEKERTRSSILVFLDLRTREDDEDGNFAFSVLVDSRLSMIRSNPLSMLEGGFTVEEIKKRWNEGSYTRGLH